MTGGGGGRNGTSRIVTKSKSTNSGFSLCLMLLTLLLWLSPVVVVDAYAKEERSSSSIINDHPDFSKIPTGAGVGEGGEGFSDKLVYHPKSENHHHPYDGHPYDDNEFSSSLASITTPPKGRNLYEETTYKSWTERMGNSLVGVLIGIILSFVAPILLFWNEGRAVKRTKQIKYISENAVEIRGPNDLAEGTGPGVREGQLIHIVGRAEPSSQNIEGMGASLQDPIFGIPPISSEINHELLVLTRNVQMLQWVERSSTSTKKTAGGGEETTTTYDYDKQWMSVEVNSAAFHDPQYQYSNPSMQYQTETFYTPSGAQLNLSLVASKNNNVYDNQYYSADNVVVKTDTNANNNSIIQLSNQLLHQITPDTSYNTMGKPPPTPTNLIGNAGAAGGYGSLSPSPGQQQPPSSFNDSSTVVWTNNTTMEIGPQPANIGTHRLDWKYTKSCIVSILAKHSSYTNSLVEWRHPTDSEFTCCRLMQGEHSLADMVNILTKENTILTWVLRVLGFFIWMIAFQMIAQPLEVLFDLGTIPAFGLEPGTIVSYLTGFGSFLLAFCLSLVVIALAWIIYRPVLACLLIAASIGLFLIIPKPSGGGGASDGDDGGGTS